MRSVFLAVNVLLLAVGLAGPGHSQSLESHKALVEEFTSAANDHELHRLDAVVAEDFVRHSQATPDVAVRSRSDFKAFLAANRAVFPDEAVRLSHLVAEEDRVAFWGTYVGTQSGPMGPFPPSGKKVELDISGMFRIEEGRIAELWFTWDNLAALTQAGHFPVPAGQD